ncbi:hypothetical protein TRAPUB_34 [Trametes pubescens]|uniref:Uncharacterized protein n=1 Tax=Trametes pubescens TaxID=154538 RepID=A0A1M2VNB5_TRAPU|nr:hypothetical protein TRAPUB_34 [Trametes pubescens]
MRAANRWTKAEELLRLCGTRIEYILALERRLHQVEALLGTIISSDDPRARSLVQDLSRDKLASYVINKVNVGPFGPAGREKHP